MTLWWEPGLPLFEEEEEAREEWRRYRKYDQADEWGRKHYRQEAPEPPERPEGVRFRNIDPADPFGSKNARQVPIPPPVRERGEAVLYDEYDPDVVWREPSLKFRQADAATLNALMAPDPEPPPRHWSDWHWNGPPGRYEAYRWPEDGKERGRACATWRMPRPRHGGRGKSASGVSGSSSRRSIRQRSSSGRWSSGSPRPGRRSIRR